jgi:DNA invertase Pin-like site-specific DNA recombinase
MNNNISKSAPEPLFRCAIYTRLASVMQGSAPLINQERICREVIASKGMVVDEHLVCNDAAISGKSMGGRDVLSSLIAAASKHPCPFDYIVMADTSRLGRKLEDVLEVCQI